MLANDVGWHCLAAYGRNSRELTVNVARLGKDWFGGSLADISDLLIHEFGHHFEGDHLSARYHEALTSLGGQMAKLALDHPDLFKRCVDD